MFIRGTLALAALVAAAALTSCSPGLSQSPTRSPTGAPTTSAPETTAAPAISITSPAEGETVSVPFTVSGEANTFEAALTIDAVDDGGALACVRQLTATSGSGTPGTWEGTLAFPPEVNDLRVTLRAYAHSAKDGSMIDVVEVPITIAPDRPTIFLTSPTCGQVYEPGGLILLTGLAAVFEAALNVDVRDASGTAVVTLPVLADACCEHSNFSSSMTLPADLPPGLYDVVAYNLSPKDGSVENEFPVQIEVRG
ncbi:hypothetical protein J7E29_06900 [Streptomyces sp. ISL-90]|nr:hypothetical protein [Streptomyces sp. ISL-90]